MEQVLLIIILVVTIIVIFYIFNDTYQINCTKKFNDLIKSIRSPIKNPRINKLRKTIDQDIIYIIKTQIKNPKLSKIGLDSTSGGKRIRPIIAYSIIKKMNPNISEDKLMSVNSIELLHSASLMIDDMMDNDIIRRGKDSIHVVYGNNLTLLASTQLVMVSLAMIGNVDIDYVMSLCSINNKISRKERYKKAKQYKFIIKSIIDKTMNLIDGQTIDLDNNSTGDREMVLDVLSKKTSSIFEMIFVMSWVLGGGDPKNIPYIEKVADHFGIMFQIYDDFTDINSDRAKGFNLNYVLRFGTDVAKKNLMKENLFLLRNLIILEF